MNGRKHCQPAKEAGVLENVFLFAVVATTIVTMGAFSMFVIEAQRYQAGLDLSTHNAIRDIVENNNANPEQLAQSDLSETFQQMALNTTATAITVGYSGGRCGTVAVTERKTLNLFWKNLIMVTLSSSQQEPTDPLSAGLPGVATCIGS